MKKFFAFIGAWVYALFITMVLGVIFYYLTPFVINLSWLGLVIFYLLFFFMYLILAKLTLLMMLPLMALISVFKHAKWFPILSFVVNGIYSLRFIWYAAGRHFEFREILFEIGILILMFSTYGSLAFFTFTFDYIKDDFNDKN